MAAGTVKMWSYVVVFLALLTLPAGGAVIRGRVQAPNLSSGSPPPRYVTRGGANPAESHSGPSEDKVAVVVERLDGPATSLPTAMDTALIMAQEGTAFVPNILIVPVGGVVSFPNHDPLFHNVFSYSSTRTFDLGRYPRGQSRTVTFDRPGIVRVFCEIHASMYAAIVVAGSPWYRLLSTDEQFEFDGIPAGRYKILAVDPTGRFTDYEVMLADKDVQEIHLRLGN
jgi:plastocyanin